MKAILPASLKVLLEQFEANQEASIYFVAPPTLRPGSAYEFGEKYFHAHNNLLMQAEMSEELTILTTMLTRGLTVYMAFYTQLKHPGGPIIFTLKDVDHYGLALGLALKPDPNGVLPMWSPNGGAGTYLGFRTSRGILPFARLGEFQQAVMQLRGPNAPRWDGGWGGYGAQTGYAGYGGGYAPRPFHPLDLPPSIVEEQSAHLAGLLNQMIELVGHDAPDRVKLLIDQYVNETENLDELTEEEVEAKKLTISRDFAKPQISWRVFVLGMKVLKIDPTAIVIETKAGNKFRVEQDFSAEVWGR